MKFTISNRWTLRITIDLFDYHEHIENLKIYHIKTICRHDTHTKSQLGVVNIAGVTNKILCNNSN